MNIIKEIIFKIVGSRNARLIKGFKKIVVQINNIEPEIKKLSDEDLQAKTQEFKERINNQESLDSLLPEAFAVIREASFRVLGLRHYDMQLIGGMVLNNGCIAEMGTGEGKTLVATLPAYLNALDGNSVHIITVNDYLATRDSEWMGRVFNFLGLSVGAIISNMATEDRKKAYLCDIVYATNNEVGFDYLRDNMAFQLEQKVQRKLNFVIIDEVDSILIDEARTPLIISGPSDDYSFIYKSINNIISRFKEQIENIEDKEIKIEKVGDYTIDEKRKLVVLTDEGHSKAEKLLTKAGILKEGASLYDANNITLMQHINSALKAHILYVNNIDYIVKEDEIVIVDEFTGRTMPGRRWSEGLHQAIEAKENVSIKKENQTLASITFQNYFRLYKKLSGMTGTADTEAVEFQNIYNLETVVVPPNKTSARDDMTDHIYMTTEEKFEAIVEDIIGCQKQGQPVLVGTSSIESSEIISSILNKKNIKHEVLNAKQHEREAHIITNAGTSNSVTIATNMAGRGTDIVLGGKLSDDASEQEKKDWIARHNAVIKSGGLHIIGTERNESRRVDNQLRGRSGRQGDVGSTRFYLSLEDNLMRIFASEKTISMMRRIGIKKGEVIEHKMINRAIENAQKKVEAMNYEARKHLLEYDDIANYQRKVVYKLRDEIISANDVYERFVKIRKETVTKLINDYMPIQQAEDSWDIDGLSNAFKSDYSTEIDMRKLLDSDASIEEVEDKIVQELELNYSHKEQAVGANNMRLFEKAVMLQTLDSFWKEHLAAMDYLRQGVVLRTNPVQEYKRESFAMFEEFLTTINIEIVKTLSSVNVNKETEVTDIERKNNTDIQELHDTPTTINTEKTATENQKSYRRQGKKIGRNDPCPCGSGKKYKKCHG